ncbi:MAG TPA: acetyl-CoA C-acetyltransferase [Myxococcales bacterium]|jgi:acetyl-CoA C-acetyltransferase|nr:acetyl-CoA C-acetyltransferase [Myxococcales bacterium]
MSREVVIVGAARTPIGAFLGSLSSVPGPRLGAVAIKAALERAGVKPEEVDAVYMGCVLQGGVGQAPARQAMRYAGLPDKVPAVTVNKVCGSGMQTVIYGVQAIKAGDAEVVIAGGMESMSNAPYVTHGLRGGARMGHHEIKDMMIFDGLWDPYSDQHMGMCGEKCAAEQGFSRAAQDEFSKESTLRAQKAQVEGLFKPEIAPVEVPQRKGEPILVADDDGPKNAKPDKLTSLRPAFKKDGTITAGNASSINDGAAALVLMSEERAKKEGRTILGRIRSYASFSREPVDFTIAPVDAMKIALDKANLKTSDIDLFEVNEAFAVVTMAAAKGLELPMDRVNVRGGAVVLGHPIGASGSRIIVTLLQAMKDLDKKRGMAGICIGGGEALAMVIERP